MCHEARERAIVARVVLVSDNTRIVSYRLGPGRLLPSARSIHAVSHHVHAGAREASLIISEHLSDSFATHRDCPRCSKRSCPSILGVGAVSAARLRQPELEIPPVPVRSISEASAWRNMYVRTSYVGVIIPGSVTKEIRQAEDVAVASGNPDPACVVPDKLDLQHRNTCPLR